MRYIRAFIDFRKEEEDHTHCSSYRLCTASLFPTPLTPTRPLWPVRYLRLLSDDDGQTVQMLHREADDELSSRQSMYLIPQVVHLLRSCKALTTQLTRAVVDGSTAEGTRIVTGSLNPVLEAARPVGRR